MKYIRELLIEAKIEEKFDDVYDKFKKLSKTLSERKSNIEQIKKISNDDNFNNEITKQFNECKQQFNAIKKDLKNASMISESTKETRKEKYNLINSSEVKINKLNEKLKRDIEKSLVSKIKELESN